MLHGRTGPEGLGVEPAPPAPLPPNERGDALESRRGVEARARERQGLDRLRARLRIGDQSLLSLRYEQGLSWAQVGEILGAHPDALMQRHKRLKDRMGRMARDEGLLE